MRVVIVLMFILPCFFIGCGDIKQKSSEPIIKKEFYPDGTLMIEQAFVNDSIAEGFYRKYHPNGKIQIELNYRNNVEDGKETSYYEGGAVHSIVNYADGIRTGPAEWYYEGGGLQTKTRYFKDKATGEAYDYNPDGPLQRYLCFDFDEQVRFEIKYDKDGNMLSRQGEGLIYANADDLTLNVGDTLKLFALVATPPDCTYRMEVTTDIKTSEKIIVPVDEENSVYEYEKVVTKEGKFKFVGTFYLKYKDGTESHETFAGEYEVAKSPSE